MNNNTAAPGFGNAMLFGVLFLGLILAAFLGVLVGETDLLTLTLLFAVVGAGLFAISLHRYVWQISIALIFSGFGFRPTSFAFGPVEITCGLGFAVIGIFIWQNKKLERPDVLNSRSFAFLQRMLFVWLAYVLLHMVYNMKVPYRPQDYVFNNAIKSYFGVSASLLLLYCFSRKPAGLVAGRKFLQTIAFLAAMGLFFNLAIDIYVFGNLDAVLTVPLLNASPNPMVLRTHGPLAMLLGIVAITAPQWRRSVGIPRFLGGMLLPIGTLGTLLSGGRASLLIGVFLVCCVLMFRRKVMALAVVASLAVVTLAVANMFSGWINTRASPHLQRSVQWALINKNAEVMQSLESSSDWRTELAKRALTEWRSDWRIFWTGRSTYGFGVADERAILLSGGFEALIQTSLRRGATHNMLTDLLVAYGLIGCILYLMLYLAIFVWLWNLRKDRRLTPAASSLALICLVGWIGNVIFETLGAGSLKIEMIWFMITLLGVLYGGIGIAETAAPLPEPARPVLDEPRARQPFRRRQLALGRSG